MTIYDLKLYMCQKLTENNNKKSYFEQFYDKGFAV